MPDTDHNNPSYEETFSKIATLFEKLTAAHIGLTESVIDAEKRLTAAIERLATKSDETEDKVNGLIDLLDRHIREHGKP